MVRNQIVRQLMTKYNPPIHQRVRCLTLQRRTFMQLLEIEVVAENATATVERDGLAIRLEEDVHCARVLGEDRTDVAEKGSKDGQASRVLREVDIRTLRSRRREEHLDTVFDFCDKSEIMSGMLVAVRGCLINDVGFATREDVGGVVATGLLD